MTTETTIPTLETERLWLRPFRPDDFEDYALLSADPEVARYLLRGAYARDQAWRVFAFLLGHWQLKGHGMWVLEAKESGAFVGVGGFAEPEGWPGFELAGSLARRFWGKGYALEAARAALDHAFTTLGRDRVICLIHPENRASIRVAERLGARLEGSVDLLGEERRVYAVVREPRGGAAAVRIRHASQGVALG